MPPSNLDAPVPANAATRVGEGVGQIFAGSTDSGITVHHRRWYSGLDRILLWLVLTIGAVAMVAPFYWMLITSFKVRQEVLRYPPTWWPEEFTWTNWQALNDLTAGSFSLFFRNSTFVASSITILTLLISAMAGYVFAKLPFRGRDQIFWVVLSMMMIPFTVSIIPSFALMDRFGWIDSYLALIIPIIFNPFGIFLMRQFMMALPTDLLDAARMDGASEFRVFFQIAVPLSQAALAALGILTFLAQWDNFLWPLVILQDPDKYTVPIGLAQFRGRMGIDVGPTAAGSILAVLPVLVIYIFAQRKFVEGIALTGLKG
jgi:multiple sugar transport system permease protein